MKKEFIIKLIAALIGVIIAVVTAFTEGVHANTFAFVALVSALTITLAIGMSTLFVKDYKFSPRTLILSVLISVFVFLLLGIFV
jgi:predicted permease